MVDNKTVDQLEKDSLGPISDQPLVVLDDTESKIEPKVRKPSKGGPVTVAIREGLLSGATEQELVDEGYNARSVRFLSQKLEKEGLRVRPHGTPGTKNRDKQQQKALALQRKNSLDSTIKKEDSDAALLATTKALPAESIINLINIPVTGLVAPLEQGIKIGMNLVVLGVRLSQEMSSIGIQQSRPLLAMAREMRSGEQAAAESASADTAVKVANQLAEFLGPQLSIIAAKAEENARALADIKKAEEPKKLAGENPMKEMMARAFEPMLKSMITNVQKTMMPGINFDTGTNPSAPSGWTVKKVE